MILAIGPKTAVFFVLAVFVVAVFVLAVFVRGKAGPKTGQSRAKAGAKPCQSRAKAKSEKKVRQGGSAGTGS